MSAANAGVCPVSVPCFRARLWSLTAWGECWQVVDAMAECDPLVAATVDG